MFAKRMAGALKRFAEAGLKATAAPLLGARAADLGARPALRRHRTEAGAVPDRARSQRAAAGLEARGETMTHAVPVPDEALANAGAMIVAANGRSDAREFNALDRLDAFRPVGVSRERFVDTARTRLGDLAPRQTMNPSDPTVPRTCMARRAR